MFKTLFASLMVIAMMACHGTSSSPTPAPTPTPTPTPKVWGMFRLPKAPAATLVAGKASASASVTGTTTMSVKRVYHTATQIPDGRIVIIGGAGGNGEPAPLGIDIFDPLSERFTPAVTQLPLPRISHQAVLMDDGRIAIIGGGGNDQIDVYDPIADTLTPGVMTFEHERREFVALAVGGNRILVFGGYNNDPGQPQRPPVLIDTKDWTQRVVSTEPVLLRRFFATTPLKNGKVLFSGGFGGATYGVPVAMQDVLIFDPAAETFTITGAMQETRIGHTMLELPNGTVGIYGGGLSLTTETFSFATNTSAYSGNLISTKSFMLSALLQNGYTLHCGGKTGNLVTNTQMVYDPASKESGYTNSMLTSRKDFTLTVMPNGYYLVTGGQDELGNALLGAEVFDPQASVTVTYPTAVLPYTESVQLTATGDTAGLVWTCDAGTVTQTGLFTAPGLTSTASVAYITATNAKGKAAIVHVAFTRDIVSVSGPTTVIKDSLINNYKSSVVWYQDQSVTWSTDKGTISATGVLDVTGVPLGETVNVKATLKANPVFNYTLPVSIK